MQDKTKRIIRYSILLAGLLLASYVAEKLVHSWHGTDMEQLSYAGFGFVSCTVLILIAKFLSVFIKRDETYYEDN